MSCRGGGRRGLGGYALLLAMLFMSPLQAQESGLNDQAPLASPFNSASSGASLLPDLAADAPAPKPAWTIDPRISMNFTMTDNARLAAEGKSDTLFVVTPGIRIEAATARIKGYFDGQLDEINYLNDVGRDRSQKTATGRATFELLDNWLFLDTSTRIYQQNISAFGTQSAGTIANNSNQTSTTTRQLSPYIRGRFAGLVDYQYRLSSLNTDTASGSNEYDTRSQELYLAGATPLSAIGWQVNANTATTEYANGFKYQLDSARLSANYNYSPALKLMLIGGSEANDLSSYDMVSSSISGYGFDWAPTPRTKLAFTQEERFFGTGHKFEFSHRTARTRWSIKDSKDAQLRPPQTNGSTSMTWADLVQDLCSTLPPADQARCVSENLAIMDPNTIINPGSLQSGATLARLQSFSLALVGVRNTLTFTMSRSDQSKLGDSSGLPDDFSTNLNVRQSSMGVNWTSKMTRDTSLMVSLGRRNSVGSGASNQETDFDSMNVSLNSRFGSMATGSLSYRRSDMTSNVSTSYIENAYIAALMLRF